MKPQQAFSWLCAVLFAVSFSTRAGTWSDHFSFPTLLEHWKGDRDFFQIVNQELMGISADPIRVSPFVFVEIEADSTDCSVGAWMQVVSPNTHRCTKGAIVLRHTGTNGYVFALHEATQTAEVYRLSNHEMLLNKPWKIDLQKWYYVRVEAHGPTMQFFIDGVEVGGLTDSKSLSGAVGLAAQDANAVLFDDFTITGPKVVGNVDNVPPAEVASVEAGPNGVTLRFTISGAYDYYVQVSSSPEPSRDWQTIAMYASKAGIQDIVFTDTNATGLRFYRIEKVPCYCR